MTAPEAVLRPGRWKGVLASFLVPGAGQYLQGRTALAAIILLYCLLNGFLVGALLAASSIPVWLPLGLILLSWAAAVWILCDAWRPTGKVGWKRWLLIGIILLVVFTIEKRGLLCLFGMYRAPTPSMAPTIEKGDQLFCLRAAYWRALPQRGDIIAFATDDVPDLAVQAKGETFEKRVVGLPGDVLRIKDHSLRVNGIPYRYPGQQEDYCSMSESSYLLNDADEYVVPRGTCFVLGDHPSVSYDSRFFGAIPFSSLRGKMEAIVWPLSRSSHLR